MATLERQGYKAYQEPDKRKYKGGLGNYVGDLFRFAGDNALSLFGANDVITDESYKTKELESIAKATNPLYSLAGKAGAEILAPGIGGTVMGAVQGTVGQISKADTPQGYEGYNDIINSLGQIGSQFIGGTPSLPMLAKYGGSMNKKSYKTGGNLITTSSKKQSRGMDLIEFDGPTHEANGIKTRKDIEVEGGEMEITNFNEDGDSYVLSNRLGKGGYKSKKKDQSFADLGKKIKAKYSLRGDTDKLSNLAREKELRKLVEEHEMVREGLGLVDNPQMFLGGGTIESLLRAKHSAGFQLGKSNLDLSLDNLVDPSTATAPELTLQFKNKEGFYGNVGISSLDTLKANNSWYDWNSFDANNPESVGAFQKAFNTRAGKDILKVDNKLGEQTANAKLDASTLNFQGFGKEFNPFWQAPENLNLSGKKSTTQSSEESYTITPEASKDTISPFNLDKAKQLGNIATAAQMATAIPGLTTRASDVNYNRVTAPEIDLSSQRRASELSRNRIIASNRAGARGADSVGMALNFLGAANAGAQGQYGNEVAQSFLSEEQFNKQYGFEASKINADINRTEQEARIAEEDAARSMQLQSLADMAGYIGMGAAGQNQLSMAEGQINMLQNMGDFIFGIDEQGNPVFRKKKYVDTKKKYGGVIKRNRRK